MKKFGSQQVIDVRRTYNKDDLLYIFIVRDAQRDSVRIEGSVQFGNKPEWIVFNFNKVPTELFISAKRIPSPFGQVSVSFQITSTKRWTSSFLLATTSNFRDHSKLQ